MSEPDETRLTHVDEHGSARMVDIAAKPVTARSATATAALRTTEAVIAQLADGGLPKGDAIPIARVAAIMAAKKTPELVPLCHPLPITGIDIEFGIGDRLADTIDIRATLRTTGKTGVEMEALTAVTVGALTLYDMVKGVDRAATIVGASVLEKHGGQSGDWQRAEEQRA